MHNTNNISVNITASRFYSYAAMCAHLAPVLSVSIHGLSQSERHSISVNIYGIGKSGFFIEKTNITSRHYYTSEHCFDGSGRIIFDLSRESLNFKRGFFENLKTPCPGNIYAEVIVDGKKHLAQSSLELLPKNVFSPDSPPDLLAYCIYPCSKYTRKTAGSCDKNLRRLYSAIKSCGFIYSVKTYDYTFDNIELKLADSLTEQNAKIASPLEMAIFFASCAVSAGLYPVICAVKNGAATKFLCGAAKDRILDRPLCDSHSEFCALIRSGKVSVFDVSSLFTGHNIDFDDACRSACAELIASDLIFACDIVGAIKDRQYPMSLSECDEKMTRELIDSLRQNGKSGRLSISDYAEMLSGVEDTPLLSFVPDISDDMQIPVCLSSIEAADALARSAKPIFLASVSGKIDIQAIAPLSSGISSMIAKPNHYDINIAERQDILAGINNFTRLLSEKESSFEIGCLSDAESLEDKCRNLSLADNVYLACGFLQMNGNYAPLALFPIGVRKGSVEIKESVPYANRLLAEYIFSKKLTKGFLEVYGLPSGSATNIISYFEKLASEIVAHGYAGVCRVVKECFIASFPVSDTRLSFALVENYDKLAKDPLTDALVSGTMTDSPLLQDSITNIYKSRIYQLEKTSPALCDGHLRVLSASADNDILLVGQNGCGITDTVFSVACENLRCGKKTLILCPRGTGLPNSLKNKFEKSNLLSPVLTLTSDKNIKSEISKKLKEFTRLEANTVPDKSADDFAALKEKLDSHFTSKSKKYPFGFSFYELAREFEKLGEYLSDDELEALVLPENLYLPDITGEDFEKLIKKSTALCKRASELSGSSPVCSHPLFDSKLTDGSINLAEFARLYERAHHASKELSLLCEGVVASSGVSHADLRSLSCLYAFISLVLTVMTEYDCEISKELLHSDIYAVSKNLETLRALSDRISSGESELEAEFEKEAVAVCDKFPVYWNGQETDFDKLFGITSFIKAADLLAKKIFGTDADKRADLLSHFYDIYSYCEENKEEIIKITECYEALFDDKHGSAVLLAAMLMADIYSVNFADGILSAGGLAKLLSGWNENISKLPLAASYNIAANECRSAGLFAFVNHIEKEGCSRATEYIFTRSLLFLACNQIKFSDKTQLSYSQYGRDRLDFADAQKKISVASLSELTGAYITACLNYINSNMQKTNAFSDSLSDPSLGSHQLLSRHCDIVTNLFPIIVAEPEYACCLDGFSNLVVLGGEVLPAESVLPVLPCAKHKIICTQYVPLSGNSIASAVSRTGICTVSLYDVAYKFDGRIRNYFDKKSYSVPFLGACNMRHLKPPVSSYSKDSRTNVLEAQSIGLELLRLYEENAVSGTVGIATLTKAQKYACLDVLATLCEKSVAIKEAVASGSLAVFYTGGFSPNSYDTCYISTVYGKDESGNVCCDFGELDRTEEYIDGISPLIIKAVGCAKRSLVVVSSLSAEHYPEKASVSGAWQIARLIEFADKKTSQTVPTEDNFHPLGTSLAKILKDGGICASPLIGGCGASFEHEGKVYAVVPEKTDSYTTFDREASLCDKLRSRGYILVPINSVDITLNAQNILSETAKTIKKEITQS